MTPREGRATPTVRSSTAYHPRVSRDGFGLGRVAGIRIRVAPSWLVIAAIITLLYAEPASLYTGRGAPAYLAAFAFAVLLALSVLVHEATHAVVARRFGLDVHEIVVTLWGGHTSLGQPRTPLQSGLVALLAPLANLGLGAVFYLATAAGPESGTIRFLLLSTWLANVAVGLFNLLPGLPLDGGRVAEAVIWAATRSRDRGTLVAGYLGRLVVVVAVVWFVVRPVLQQQTPSVFLLLWVVFLGANLWQGASAAITVARTRLRVGRVPLAGVARPAAPMPADATVDDWWSATGSLRKDAPPVVVVIDGAGRPVGVVDHEAASRVSADQRSMTALAPVSVRLPDGAWVAEGATALDAAERLDRLGGPGLAVVRHPSTVVGWVPAADLARAVEQALGRRGTR